MIIVINKIDKILFRHNFTKILLTRFQNYELSKIVNANISKR